MEALKSLDWSKVRSHYDERLRVHKQLLDFLQSRSTIKFSTLALGVDDPTGNYSAVEHGLGPKILGLNPSAESQVFRLAEAFARLESARGVPQLIRKAEIKYLQIGVGSEISCMVNPKVCWVANSRTIWTHLLVKHADDFAKADEELRLYRDSSAESEMAYQIWAAIHAELDVALTRVAELGAKLASRAQVTGGEITYLWADAIASELYEVHHSESRTYIGA